MKVKPLVYIGVPVIALGFLIFNRLQTIQANEADAEKESGARRGAPASVEVATAQSYDIIESIESVGTVTPEFTVNLAPRTTGVITYLEVREGEVVKPGQLLARINPDQANASVLSARASINESRSRLTQAQATVQANNIQIQQNIRQARAEVANAKANLNQTEKQAEADVISANADVTEAQAELASAQATLKNRGSQVTAARANLTNATTRLNRLEGLYEKGYVSAQEVDDARATVATAQANLDVRQGEIETGQADVNTAKARLESARANANSTKATTQAQIASAKARVEQAEASLASAEANRAQIPANEANVNALRAGVDSAEAQLQSAASQKSDTELRSTIAGTVTKRNADPGSIASPGQPVLVIESTDRLIVNTSIPISDSTKIESGDRANLTIEGIEDPIVARVEKIIPSADPQDRQALVRLAIVSDQASLRPGMFAKINIEVSRSSAKVAIPTEAIQDGSVMLIDKDGKAVKTKVAVGNSDQKNSEVISGIKIGDQVVVLSFSPVRPDSPVNITAERGLDGTRRVIEPPNEDKKPPGAKS